MCSDLYVLGQDFGDDQFAMTGDDDDICRWTSDASVTARPPHKLPAPSTAARHARLSNSRLFGRAMRLASWLFATAR